MNAVTLGVAAVILLAVAGFVVQSRRRSDPTRTRYARFADMHGWGPVAAEEVRRKLDGLANYLDGRIAVEQARGGDTPSGPGVVATLARRERPAGGRSWHVAVVERSELALPHVQLHPRSVRTVRVVGEGPELDLDDPGFRRRWTVVTERVDAASMLLTPAVREQLDAAADRTPWPVGVQLKGSRVAVHLARADDEPRDADDLRRLVDLATRIAGALPDRDHP